MKVNIEDYKPIKNPYDDNTSYDDCMFETYGDELKFVQAADSNKVWTVMETDDGEDLTIVSGFRYVNRMGYIITAIPWKTGEEYDE